MILNDTDLRKWAKNSVVPFDPACINPASLDLKIGSHWVDLYDGTHHHATATDPIVIYPPSTSRDWLHELQVWWCKRVGIKPPQHKPSAILAITEEWVWLPDNMAADLKLKTTPARQGLNHTLAGWVDPGYGGRLTLTLHAFQKVALVPGRRICQLVVHKLDQPCARSYREVGHYNGQQTPTPAKEIKHAR